MENDEIARYLASLEREDCYFVDETLKESPHELTQRVYFVGANGAKRGPYVRKLIHRDSGMGAAYERIFMAQQHGQRFKHVPAIYECYQHEDLLVVVMEFVNGETLQDRVYRLDPSIHLATNVFPQLCNAVTELHKSFNPPLIHRDLKPSNVMLTTSGLTIIDFGIARAYKQGSEADTTKFGTRAFAPPEQFGFGQTTVRSDIYALGMLLYYCLTEKIPTSRIRDAKFDEPDVPESLRPILIRATELDPAERYTSAEELEHAFLEAVSRREPTRAPRKRRPIVAAFTCIAIVALVGVLLVATGVFNLEDDQAPSKSSSAEQDASVTDKSISSSTTQSSADDASKSTVLDNMQTGAPQRNGFDPETNIVATVAGVTFQIPNYFEAQSEQDDSSATYYYAESGSSLVMIMTDESRPNASTNVTTDGFQAIKDEILAGLVGSNEELFAEIVSSTDCKLAGCSARIATIKGATEGFSITTKVVYFINQDTPDGQIAIGTIMFGQTDNAQFDYSTDFANTIASATPTP